MDFKNLLKTMTERNASDLYLTAGSPPAIKIQGQIHSLESEILSAAKIQEIANSVTNEKQRQEFELSKEMNLGIADDSLGRFRLNIYRQRNTVAIVVRCIKVVIPTPEELKLPPVLTSVIMQKRGLILFVGGTGAGKSTSLASLIDYRNTHSAGHIITIEDPIEFVHPNKQSIVSQREVGVDTESYTIALRNTLRQAPDVILIGEIRTAETMSQAITFAETGHLCLSTLHANNSNQAMERVISFFPEEDRQRLLLDLSLNLVAIVSQRLVPTVDGKRIAAFEILLATPLTCDLIKRGEVSALKEIIQKSGHLGMQTFDDALYKLYKEGQITLKDALEYADSQQNLRIRINLEGGVSEKDLEGLAIENIDDKPTANNDLLNWAKTKATTDKKP